MEEGGSEVPFLTVLKGEDVIDNICLEGQDTLAMGRHHTCDLVVGHASSSRKHLEIQIIHATREIILTDLCSVHGTWVGGKRLPSVTPTIFKDNVIFQIASSRRFYRINWQPAEVAQQSSGSGLSSELSVLSSSVDNAQEASYHSESLPLSGLRHHSNGNQDHRPSAPPYAVEKVLIPQDENVSPALGAASRMKSPAMVGELRKSLSSPKVLYTQDENVLRKSLSSPKVLYTQDENVLRKSFSSPKVVYKQDEKVLRKSLSSPKVLYTQDENVLRKSLSSPKHLYTQDENVSPVVRDSVMKPGQLNRSANSPSRPTRRLAFSTLQSSATSARSPMSPSMKKPLTERTASSGSLKFPPPSPQKTLIERSGSSGSFKRTSSTKIPLKKPKVAAVREVTSTPSKLWLRRCSSAPLPALATGDETSRPQGVPRLAALDEDRRCLNDESGGDPSIAESGNTDYPSDKENVEPKSMALAKVLSKSMERVADSQGGATSTESSAVESIVREPFRPLYCTSLDVRPLFHQFQSRTGSRTSSDDDYGSKVLGLPRPQHRISSAQNLDQMLRRLRINDRIEGRRQWHVVVDTNCLLEAESLKALKQLEGIRETCIIIPKIVVRDLDCLKQKRSSARAALKWIESSMMKLPTWIHVQSSSETLPVRVTPPASPSRAAFPHYADLMSPTNNDYVLECAMIFDMTVNHGKVALLTKDTALKIKAMAEGLVSESASEFCESLLSPYSNRFLWAGSTAHGKTWVDRSAENSPASSYPGELKPTSSSHVMHSLEDLRHHVNAQPRGLKLVVTQ